MPKPSPLIKIEATRQYGAEVVLAGEVYDEAYAEAVRLQEENGYVFVHPSMMKTSSKVRGQLLWKCLKNCRMQISCLCQSVAAA